MSDTSMMPPRSPGVDVKELSGAIEKSTASAKSKARITEDAEAVLRERKNLALKRLTRDNKLSALKGGKNRRRKTKKQRRQSRIKRS